MTVFTGIVLYVILYWLVIFAVLPFGNRPADDVIVGNAPSAPADPRLKQKFLVTGVVAAVFWLAIFTAIKLDVIDFYDIAGRMAAEDEGQ